MPSPPNLTPFSDPSQYTQNSAPMATDIEQVDKALNPRDDRFTEWWQKSRLTGEAQPAFDHIMSHAIAQGSVKAPFDTHDLDAAEALAITHVVTTYALEGKGRDEMTSVFSGVGGFIRRYNPMSRMGRRSNYEGSDFQQ